VTRELIDCLADHGDRICPHLHVCLQSGSDAVLRRMKRRWTARSIIDRCRLVRERLMLPALTTDVIVGFPGESEADFRETCQAVREIGFSKIHIFSFSPRKGTPAAEMSDQIAPEVKRDRHQRLATIEAELRDAYFRSLLDRRLEVLVEASPPAARMQSGVSCRYAAVEFRAGEPLAGQLVSVVAKSVSGGRIQGSC
jgi:threonylcarbamoyladenosine tRNA methylthiotransferase MtaB